MKVPLRLFAAALLLAFLAAAAVPWPIGGSHVRSGLSTQIGQETGWKAELVGGITLKLLPRPRIQVTTFKIADADGGFELDALGLRGDLDLAALATGRWRLTAATLIEPTMTFEPDKIRLPPFMRRLAAAPAGGAHSPKPADAEQARLAMAALGEIAEATPPAFRLAIRSGVLRVKSERPGADTLVTDIDATWDRAAADDGVSLSGEALWHGTRGRFAARIAHVDAVLQGGESHAALQVVSPVASFTASGSLAAREERRFVGHVALSAPSLSGLMRLFDIGQPPLKVGRVQLGGDAVADRDAISLSNIALRLDRTAFEGTLAFRKDGETHLVEGTLATDMLDLDSLAASLEPLRGTSGWYTKPFDGRAFSTNVDLRVSAAASRIGQVGFEDTALSVLLRDGQMEVSLDEARAFAGTVKARALAKVVDDGIEAHADVSVADVDLGPLSNVVSGQERVSGTLSGHMVLDGRGRAPADVVHSLSGQGDVTVEDGNFMGLSVTQALRRFSRRLPLGSDLSGQITTFDTASSTFKVDKGVVDIAQGYVKGPGMRVQFGGRSDLAAGRILLEAIAAATNAEGSVLPDGPRFPFEMRGDWRGPYRLIERATGAELPIWPWPFMQPPPALR